MILADSSAWNAMGGVRLPLPDQSLVNTDPVRVGLLTVGATESISGSSRRVPNTRVDSACSESSSRARSKSDTA